MSGCVRKPRTPVSLILFPVLVLFCLGTPACDRSRAALRLATTTSVKDSGLLDALLPAFRERYGFDVGVVAVGTGLALRLAERGEADAVITHDRAREEAFVRAGHALGRRVFAESDFVIVGPPDDPAGIRRLDAAGAFARLASAGASFASRGDSSGTHARELSLWGATGTGPPGPPGYVEVRAGMATTLQYASDKGAYTLADRATFLARRHELGLEVLVQGDRRLVNPYAVMVVNPEAHPQADSRRAELFADWLFSVEARSIIGSLRKDGEPLFRVPAAVGAASASAASGGELTVSAAISLEDALGEIGPAFETATTGAAVRLNLAASGDLRRQIEGGAPVDVFVSAARSDMDALSQAALAEYDTRRDVACNRLVVIAPADAPDNAPPPPHSLSDLRRAGKIAIGNPATVPAGRYARQALERSGLWDDLSSKLVFAEHVRQALEYVARGEVDAAFVYATDPSAAGGRVRVAFDVDPRLHDEIVYPAAVVAESRRRDLARRFIEFLSSPAASRALKSRGFSLPPCEAGSRPAQSKRARPRPAGSRLAGSRRAESRPG